MTTKEDLAVLQQTMPTGIEGVKSLEKFIQEGNHEVRKLLYDECDVLLECRYCRNLFRSLINFISHKRAFCRASHLAVVMANQGGGGDEDGKQETATKKRFGQMSSLSRRLETTMVPIGDTPEMLALYTLPRVMKELPTTTFEGGLQKVIGSLPSNLARKEAIPEDRVVLTMPQDNSSRYKEMSLRSRKAQHTDKPQHREFTSNEIKIVESFEKHNVRCADYVQLQCDHPSCAHVRPFHTLQALAYHCSLQHTKAFTTEGGDERWPCLLCCRHLFNLEGVSTHLIRVHPNVKEDHLRKRAEEEKAATRSKKGTLNARRARSLSMGDAAERKAEESESEEEKEEEGDQDEETPPLLLKEEETGREPNNLSPPAAKPISGSAEEPKKKRQYIRKKDRERMEEEEKEKRGERETASSELQSSPSSQPTAAAADADSARPQRQRKRPRWMMNGEEELEEGASGSRKKEAAAPRDNALVDARKRVKEEMTGEESEEEAETPKEPIKKKKEKSDKFVTPEKKKVDENDSQNDDHSYTRNKFVTPEKKKKVDENDSQNNGSASIETDNRRVGPEVMLYTPKSGRVLIDRMKCVLDPGKLSGWTEDIMILVASDPASGPKKKTDLTSDLAVYVTEEQQQMFFGGLIHHKSTADGKKEHFECKFCNVILPNTRDGRRHMVGHLRAIRVRCGLCGAGAFFCTDMRDHLQLRGCPKLNEAPSSFVRPGTPCMTKEHADELTFVAWPVAPGRAVLSSGKIVSIMSNRPYMPDAVIEEKMLGAARVPPRDPAPESSIANVLKESEKGSASLAASQKTCSASAAELQRGTSMPSPAVARAASVAAATPLTRRALTFSTSSSVHPSQQTRYVDISQRGHRAMCNNNINGAGPSSLSQRPPIEARSADSSS